MNSKVYCATLNGLDAQVIEVEVNISSGLPNVIMIGLVDASIRESKERVRACLKNSRFQFPLARIAINLAPGNIFKYGTQFDLSVALAILLASQQISFSPVGKLFLGELSLDGTIRPAIGVLSMVIAAKQVGFKDVYLPRENYLEASLVNGINIFCCDTFEELTDYLVGTKVYQENIKASFSIQDNLDFNFAEIVGQGFAKRGFEIAAAGGHNILLKGPPGSGKTLLAKAASSILPNPNSDQFLEIVKIYGAAGFKTSEINLKPFRNPSQSVTISAFVGGGRVPKPGEISLAHNGILFLDEFSEFPRGITESLREPLENGLIKISRVQGQYVFPAKFILVAATNPCPCGYYGDQVKKCICSPGKIYAYQRKISGPILDRIDLQINIQRVDLFAHKGQEEESSEVILKRVCTARDLQMLRSGKLNSSFSQKELKVFCILSPESENLLIAAQAKYHFSARTLHRILKLARTIADLAGKPDILVEHIAESLQYRLSE